jgi:tetratricopeptide (TPR) repeat protein
LGEDLLNEDRKQPENLPQAKDVEDVRDVSDAFQSAEILWNEGLIEESKKVLRKILIQDPGHGLAKKKLQEIHDQELSEILAGRESLRRKIQPTPWIEWDEESMISGLEKVLSLKEEPLEVLQSAIRDEGVVEELVKQLSGAQPRDWIDSGVGFLQMGLARVSIPLFRKASGFEDTYIEAKILEGQAWLMLREFGSARQSFEALYPQVKNLGDMTILCEVLYGLGRSAEGLREFEEALGFYHALIAIDSTHRDSIDRFAELSRLQR